MALNTVMVMALRRPTWTGGKGGKEGCCVMRLEEGWSAKGKPKAGGDRRILYCVVANERRGSGYGGATMR
jgi:hypothetical protein